MILTAAGSRAFDPNEIAELMRHFFSRHEVRGVICGGAQGFDHGLALACHDAKVPYMLALPNKGYANYYWKDNMHQFEEMAVFAKKITYVCKNIYEGGRHSNFLRNEWMIDRADYFIYALGEGNGTKHAVNYAKKKGITMLDAWNIGVED